jgi:hypothetical protein
MTEHTHLGLEKRVDFDFGPGRWIEVAQTRAETPIAPCPPGPGVQPGEAKRAHREGWQASFDDLERIVRE